MTGSGVRCERDVQREGGVPKRREANSKFKRQLQKFKYREGKGWERARMPSLARRRGRGDVLNYDELFALERGGVNFLNTIEFVCVAPWRRRRVLVFKSRGSVQT